MTAKDKIARRKLSLLELASDLSNVSRACKLMAIPRQQFYEIRRNFQTYGAEGLIDRLPGAKGPHPNRVSAEIEQAVLDHGRPAHARIDPQLPAAPSIQLLRLRTRGDALLHVSIVFADAAKLHCSLRAHSMHNAASGRASSRLASISSPHRTHWP